MSPSGVVAEVLRGFSSITVPSALIHIMLQHRSKTSPTPQYATPGRGSSTLTQSPNSALSISESALENAEFLRLRGGDRREERERKLELCEKVDVGLMPHNRGDEAGESIDGVDAVERGDEGGERER